MFIHQALSGNRSSQCVKNHLWNVDALLIRTSWGCCNVVWCSAVYLLAFPPPKADPKRRRLSLSKNDGWEGHSNKSEYATQKEAQKIQQSQGESGGKDRARAADVICIQLAPVSNTFVIVISTYFHQWIWTMTVPWKSRRTSSVTTAMEPSGVATTSSGIYLHIQVRGHSSCLRSTAATLAVRYGKQDEVMSSGATIH